jgi:cell division protein FtsB
VTRPCTPAQKWAMAADSDRSQGPELARLRSFFFRYRSWLILSGGLIALLIFLLVDNGILRHAELRGRIEDLKARRLSAQAEIKRYQEMVDGLEKGDSLSIEAEARRLGMVRPDEHVYWIELPEDTLKARKP